jgi:hypothetical protein
VARWLDGLAAEAARRLAEAEARTSEPGAPTFRRLAIDVAVQAALGRFFAGKLRAGVGWALYTRTGEAGRLREALDAYRAARAAFAEAAERGRVYRDDVTMGGEPWLRGHWADRLAAVDADLGDMAAEWEKIAPAIAAVAGTPLAELDADPPEVEVAHVPPAAFARGKAVLVELVVAPPSPAQENNLPPLPMPPGLRTWGEGWGEGSAQPISVRLRYRHVNQAEGYQVAEMAGSDGEGGAVRYRAAIPADYSDSPYALQYYFGLRDAAGRAWLWPGLSSDLASQPYLVVRQAQGQSAD